MKYLNSFLIATIYSVLSLTNSYAIVGGTSVQSHDEISKVTVALQMGTNICTGTIITEELILTAAHCLYDKYQLLIGSREMQVLYGLEASRPLKKGQISQYYFPKTYTNEDYPDRHDIAFLKLSESLPPSYKPAKLLDAGHILSPNQFLTFAGYGFTDGVKKKGLGTLRKVSIKFNSMSPSETEILTATPGKDTCQGDSGGPGFVELKGELYLATVTSNGPKGCLGNGTLSVSTYIPAMRTFLQEGFLKLSTQLKKPSPEALANFYAMGSIEKTIQGPWSGACYDHQSTAWYSYLALVAKDDSGAPYLHLAYEEENGNYFTRQKVRQFLENFSVEEAKWLSLGMDNGSFFADDEDTARFRIRLIGPHIIMKVEEAPNDDSLSGYCFLRI
ncbi:S1 family peptidase [Peredibacter sp. HCB2-198]|uniref:S1 family peptidase n=1 Tax=Peredibacter sp. HCB2-198 TaxID=3383025 RepID=UPI0038B5C142